jgi:selenocysteine lyase/cysteine desulfurase
MSDGPARFDRVRGLRDVLTATGAGIYLATHQAGPIPAETQAAVHESDEMELRVGRAGPDRAEDLHQREREALAVVAAVLNAGPERIVLTHGAAEAARLVALEVLEPAAGQRVVLLPGVDRAVAAAVRDVADVAGAEVDALTEVPSVFATGVALVVMSHVDADGRVTDPVKVANAARTAGARTVADIGRSAGAMPLDGPALGVDFLIADCHRWLLGPDAVASLWITPELERELPEWLRQAAPPFGRGQLLALARSVGWLLMYVELPWALARTLALADQLYEGLGAIEGVELMAAPDAHGALAAFRIREWPAQEAADELGRSIFAIVEADEEADLIRASVGAWNRESELDRFVERVGELAAHTPQTLPRRPSLTIISGPIESPEDT